MIVEVKKHYGVNDKEFAGQFSIELYVDKKQVIAGYSGYCDDIRVDGYLQALKEHKIEHILWIQKLNDEPGYDK